MGGVDGYIARGALGPDLGLIIDIGDRQVSVPATAHLEYEVIRLLNKYTPLHAERHGGSLLLRWYDTRLQPDDLGRIIHETLKKQFTLSIVSVNIIFDPLRINSLKANVYSYKEQREVELARRTEESAPFVVCRACASYAPYAFCVATVARPPCCGRSYDELAALAQFTHGMTQFAIDKGICEERNRGSYMGVDKTARLLTEGRLRRLALHSLRELPHPTTAIPECIVYYQEELEVLVILSRDYTGRGPDGKTYDTLLARVAGRAIPGFIGVSEQYILSSRFLAADGGLSSVGWMNSALKKRLKLRNEHIATEDDAVNMAALKEFLTTWRHG
jgi:acetyl-CoA synthase